jgi:glycosyltransferase involved in cell wall biosynthesis
VANSDEVTLGFTGQLIESKGLDLVIEAMGKLPESHNMRLLVAGEDTQTGGAYQEELQQLATKCGVADRIDWLGFLEDVSQLHQRVDAMVCPSRIEPLGLVPLEASQYQVPTIANRVGGLAETIQHGKTGWLVEPTVEAWVRGLMDVADDASGTREADNTSRMDKGAGAFQRTIEHYAPAVYQRRLLEVYQMLIEAHTAVTKK